MNETEKATVPDGVIPCGCPSVEYLLSLEWQVQLWERIHAHSELGIAPDVAALSLLEQWQLLKYLRRLDPQGGGRHGK